MAVDFDAKLTELAADILREAAQVYGRGDTEAWLSGYNPVLAAWNSGMFGGLEMTGSFQVLTGAFPAVTGSFPAVTGAFPAVTGAFQAIGQDAGAVAQHTLKGLFRIPGKLPAIRLPSAEDLAATARSAPTMAALEALARWLGRNGRLVTDSDTLSAPDAADAARCTGISPGYLPFVWEHALVTGWFELMDEPGQRRTWAVLGQTAYRWADGDVSGTLHVWAVVFASVLAMTLEVAADQAPQAARKLNFRGQGVALAVMLFLARRTGLSTGDVRELVRDGAIGQRARGRARKAWDAWVRDQGDPARWLLHELAALRAVTLPPAGEGDVALAPLARWALREQLALDKISVPLVRAPAALLSAADLVTLCDGVSDAEFAGEFAAWLGRRTPDRAARDLLAFAALADAQSRLTAISLVRRIGMPAHRAWRDAMQRPELRGYARIALSMLAADLPESTLPLVLDPAPDDLTWVATDLLALACGSEDPDPEQIAAQFAEAIPEGEESWIFGLMSRGSHPDVVRVLTVLGEHHPDRRVARDARKAARAATKNRAAPRPDRVPARSAGR